MRRHELQGAIYGFALPDGTYAGTYPDRIETHTGRVEYPGEDLLFLVGTRYKGVLYLAGQGHKTQPPNAWLWNGQAWKDCGKSYGVSPCAFGDGQLFISASPTHYTVISLDTGKAHDVAIGLGSQGIRYIENGQPVSGDDTYTLDTPYGLLHEYTRRGDVICGQAHEGDWAILNGRVLEQGTCRFIRLERAGDQLAITLAKFGEHKVVFHWLNVSEIANLPVLNVGTHVPNLGTTPDPPIPEPHPMPVPDESAFVASFLAPRLKNLGSEELTRTHSFEAVNALCIALRSKGDQNWGLLEKTGGANVRGRATDILLYAISPSEAQVIDVVNDAEGNPSSAWNLKDIRPIGQWKQPYPLAEQPPDPPKDPPSVDLSEVLKRLDLLGQQADHNYFNASEVLSEIISAIGALDKRLAALESKEVKVQFPPYVGKLAYSMRLTPEEPKK